MFRRHIGKKYIAGIDCRVVSAGNLLTMTTALLWKRRYRLERAVGIAVIIPMFAAV